MPDIQPGQIWRSKTNHAYLALEVTVLGVSNWMDIDFVWIGCDNGGTDTLSFYYFTKGYELATD